MVMVVGAESSHARNLPALLELLCGLGQGPAAEYVAELLQARRGHPGPQNWGDFMGNMDDFMAGKTPLLQHSMMFSMDFFGIYRGFCKMLIRKNHHVRNSGCLAAVKNYHRDGFNRTYKWWWLGLGDGLYILYIYIYILYIYIYTVRIYIYIYIYIYTVRIYIYIYIYVYMCIYTVYIYIYILWPWVNPTLITQNRQPLVAWSLLDAMTHCQAPLNMMRLP